MELSIVDPQSRKGEFLVWHQFDGSFIDFVGFVHILSYLFLKDRVVVPDKNVPPPETFLLRWGYTFHGCLVNLSGLLNVASRLF